MRNKLKYFSLWLCAFLMFVSAVSLNEVRAEDSQYPENNNYSYYIMDNADVLTDSEETQLSEVMAELSAYGNVVFLSEPKDSDIYDTAEYADDFLFTRFNGDSATMFFVDMNNRMLYIQSDGDIYAIINKDYANTITDNVYKYASDGDYYTCAFKAFSQELTLMEGGKISQPMKYICNVILAICMSMLFMYAFLQASYKVKGMSIETALSAIKYSQRFYDIHEEAARLSKIRNSSSSSGGRRRSSSSHRSSGYSGGSHHSYGGGGSHGGGGGHRF